jgi:hypothetical protein
MQPAWWAHKSIFVFSLFSLSLNKKFREVLIAYFPCCSTDRVENDMCINSGFVTFVFVAAVTFLPPRCLATISGYLYRQTGEGLMETTEKSV